jgi:hypothetical protein
LGDLILGAALVGVAMSLVGFVGAFKLFKLLTRDWAFALLGAFLFVAALPYLQTSRFYIGGTGAHFAILETPLCLYFLLRATRRASLKTFVPAVLALLWQWQTHAITAFSVNFFYGSFLALQLAWVAIAEKGKWAPLRKYLKRILSLALLEAFVLALGAYYFFPIFLETDILIKWQQNILTLLLFDRCVSFLSLWSATDLHYLLPIRGLTMPFQIGLVPIAGAAAFAFLARRDFRSRVSYPALLLGALIVIFIGNSSLLARLPFFQDIQFSYRLIPCAEILGLILFILALSRLAARERWGERTRRLAPLGLALAGLGLAAPYYYVEADLWEDYPRYLTASQIAAAPFSPSSVTSYFRVFDQGERVGLTGEAFWVYEEPGSDSEKKSFRADLSVWSQTPGYQGELAFNFLYYPLLMDVTVKLDGEPISVPRETFWHRKRKVARVGLLEKPAFFALKLKNLPARGLLTVETRFRGSRAGNIISGVAFAGLALAGALKAALRRRSARNRAKPATPAILEGAE